MPTKYPTTVQECHDLLIEKDIQIGKLEERLEHNTATVIGRSVSEKVLLAAVAGLVTVLGGGAVTAGILNNHKIDQVERRVDQTHQRTDEVGSGVDDIKREVRRGARFEESK